MRPAPPGHERVWELETDVNVEMAPPGWKRGCRWGMEPARPNGCGEPAVWRICLGGRKGFERWGGYCARHTFGRRIVAGRLEVCVLRAVT